MKGLLKSLVRRAGYEVRRVIPGQTYEERRRLVLSTWAIDVVFDVGGNEGQYASDLRAHGYAGRIVSFEPQRAAFERLAEAAAADPLWEARRLALGAESGSVTINIGASTETSSVLPVVPQNRNVSNFEVVGAETVPMGRLDDVAAELLGEDEHVYLKLDVQGYEAEVLRGARDLLQRVRAVELELILTPMYEGQAHYLDLLRIVDDAGLRLGVAGPGWINPYTGRSVYMDVIATRPPPPGVRTS